MTTPENGGQKARFSIWRLLPVALLVGGLVAFFVFDLDVYLSFDILSDNRDFLSQYVAENFVAAALIYTIGYIAVIAFSLPGGAILSLTGGFLFGIAIGSVLTIVGATIGATTLFVAAKTAFGEVLQARAGAAVNRMRDGFQKNAFSYLLFLRLIPVFPFWLVNLVPALLNIPLSVYMLATLIGIIPGTVVYVSVGNGLGAVLDAGRSPDLGIIFDLEILLPLIGLALLSLVPILYKRFSGKADGEQS
ncbi:MAG: TVP38/TMEM64 family protein [Alphaproteobacteria bacterium]|nr:TVP38/TMEM64 family protein [Alphaproteobacteria bacterium]